MKLTEKALSKFIKYYTELDNDVYCIKGFGKIPYPSFNELPDSMKFGVYVDFFDSVGIEIYYQCDETLIIFDNGEPVDMPFRQFDNRKQAQPKAVEKANEILNERYE